MLPEVIPVLDLAARRAVHARGGDRAQYGPVVSVLAPGRDGDPIALGRAYREVVGASRCYVADLDAITGAAVQVDVLRRLAAADAFAGTLLVDAGLRSAADARALAPVPGQMVVGLETFERWDQLPELLAEHPGLVVSVDVRHGVPLRPGPWSGAAPADVARFVAAAGVRELIVLDLARVGLRGGSDLDTLRAVRRGAPDVRLLSGGGVRHESDLVRLAEAGVDGVLVASALHDGALVPRGQSPTSGMR